VESDEDGEAEAEDENGDDEVGVSEDGFCALGFVHGVTSRLGFDCSSEQGLKPTFFRRFCGTTEVMP
jgi:hypothetical protein